MLLYWQKGVISVGNQSLYVYPLKYMDGTQTRTDPYTAEYHIVYKYESEKKVCPTAGM